jgi:hypothetical protein
MLRKVLIALGVVVAASGAILATGQMALSNGGRFAGPGTGITGNDTGGIFPYTPDVEQAYEQIASDYCARWGRLSHVTSVHRKYGDYVAFVCIDKPDMIH